MERNKSDKKREPGIETKAVSRQLPAIKKLKISNKYGGIIQKMPMADSSTI